jgi:hypothetical protein
MAGRRRRGEDVDGNIAKSSRHGATAERGRRMAVPAGRHPRHRGLANGRPIFMDLLTFHFQVRVRRRCRHWTWTPPPALYLPGRHPLTRGRPRKPRAVGAWEMRASSGPQWISLFGCGRCSTPADGNKPNVLSNVSRASVPASRLPFPQAAPKKRPPSRASPLSARVDCAFGDCQLLASPASRAELRSSSRPIMT